MTAEATVEGGADHDWESDLCDLGSDPAWSAQQPHDQEESPSSFALFAGDRGELTLAARKALVAVVKQRFISAETHREEWAALLAHEDAISSRLNDLFLVLVIDRERETAWKDQADPDGGGGRPFPTLLYRQTWNREATIAMVFLRRAQLQSARVGHTTTYVDREQILGAIDAARPRLANDHFGDGRRAAKAIEDLQTAGLLIGPKGADRLVVARAIEALLPQDALTALAQSIESARGEDDPAEDTTESEQL